MQLLATYPFLNLYLHESSSRAIEAEWRGFISSSLLRQATLEALELARHHQITGWIADDRLLGPVRPVDLAWIATEALPILIETGVKRFARLEAEAPLNKLLINQAQQTAQQKLPFEMKLFTDLAEARAWASGIPA